MRGITSGLTLHIKFKDDCLDFLFYSEKKPSDVESVNGAMKIITGLDWIGVNPPYPERLIETFLNIQPNDDGCDLVDTVYVLYMCLYAL